MPSRPHLPVSQVTDRLGDLVAVARAVPGVAQVVVTGLVRTVIRLAPGDLTDKGKRVVVPMIDRSGRSGSGTTTGAGETNNGRSDATQSDEDSLDDAGFATAEDDEQAEGGHLPGVGEPLVLPDEVEQAVDAAEPGESLAHDELPLPDYDHLTLGSLRGRMRSLDTVQLHQLLDYEKVHANRLNIVTMFENRLRKLSEEGVEPSGGSPDAPRPEAPGGASGGSKVSPTTSPDPAAAAPHGVPGNNQDSIRGGMSPSQ